VASSKDRERKLARAKIDRQQAARAERMRSQRQIQARVGMAIALLAVVALGGLATHWYGLTSPKKVAAAECTWTPADLTANADLTKTGTPPTSGISMTGVAPMTITTDQGVIPIQLNVTQAPCTAESFSYLASTKFFDNTKCHRLTNSGIFVLQCGDPKGTGGGGPSYTIADENLPLTDTTGVTGDPSAAPAASVIYPAGTVAVANTGSPGTGSSQFFLVYKDSPLPPTYGEFGVMSAAGLDIVKKIAAGGVGPGGASPNDGPPVLTTTIQTLTVGKAAPGAVTAPTPSTSASVTPSPSASPTTKS
jgi:peptidyl-prolyl cis-trans isomerase B (cyclophilin B)